ncbi:lycopene cyclase domain-containing protein [Bacteroidota bacterium]
MKGLYLFINMAAVSIPFLASFGPKIQFWHKWKSLFPAIALTMLVFIPWDILFTHRGIWDFNPSYLTGIYLFNLPLEEWLFFITIPYACIFTFEVIKFFLKPDYRLSWTKYISVFLASFLLVSGFRNIDLTYTSVTFIATGLFILAHQFILKSQYLSLFYITYLFCLIPFLLVNGVLTGTFLENPVVSYNNEFNLGYRIFTIPVEDVFYGMLLILLNLTFYDYFSRLFNRKKSA